MSAMPSNEDGIGLRQWIEIGAKEVTPAEGNARSVMTTRIGVEKLGTLGTYLEGDHLQSRLLQASLDGDRAGAGSDIPQDMRLM